MTTCIFCKIINKVIPKNYTYEDESVVVFPDIHPLKPVHLLIIPKKHIEDFFHVGDDTLRAKLFSVVQRMVDEQQLHDKGYKVVINGGGHQEVPHLHIHLIGPMGGATSVAA